MDLKKQTATLIAKDFGLQAKHLSGEVELLQLLADRIALLIAEQPEYLFSLFYRLDVSEEKVHQALAGGAEKPVNVLLAELVLERQKQRAQTRLRYKTKPPLDDDLAW